MSDHDIEVRVTHSSETRQVRAASFVAIHGTTESQAWASSHPRAGIPAPPNSATGCLDKSESASGYENMPPQRQNIIRSPATMPLT